jgi:hypothetical protein
MNDTCVSLDINVYCLQVENVDWDFNMWCKAQKYSHVEHFRFSLGRCITQPYTCQYDTDHFQLVQLPGHYRLVERVFSVIPAVWLYHKIQFSAPK